MVGDKGKRGAKSGSAADLPERAAPAPALSAKARKRLAKVVRPVLQRTTRTWMLLFSESLMHSSITFYDLLGHLLTVH